MERRSLKYQQEVYCAPYSKRGNLKNMRLQNNFRGDDPNSFANGNSRDSLCRVDDIFRVAPTPSLQI